MSQEINEVRLCGAVDRIRKINTKTGSAMAEIILKVRQERIRVTAFGNLADALLANVTGGDRLKITGTLATSSWKDEATGEWRNSFTVTAWAAEYDGEKLVYQRKGLPVTKVNSTSENIEQKHPVSSAKHLPGMTQKKRRDEMPTAGPDDYF